MILAKTKKGYGMGGAGESRMTAHQQKKLDVERCARFRDRFDLPLSDAGGRPSCASTGPPTTAPRCATCSARRAELGGYLPARRQRPARRRRDAARSASYAGFALHADGKEMSTTMAVVRLFSNLLRDKTLGPRIVPIVADEARTFGMANLFRQIGIYSPVGQLYEPEDAGSMLSYREARDGQMLEEGITEAGALSSWVAAATSYSVHGVPMLPFYIYYSMFGFQRVGDLIWAAADQRARGFLIGATAGRTTLGGEGLQHQDGSSHLVAATVPNCRAYDPAFACEAGGHRRPRRAAHDAGRERDVFYYMTVMNETTRSHRCRQGSTDAHHRGCIGFAARVRRVRRQCGCWARARSCAKVVAAARDACRRIGASRQRGLERHQLQRAGARGAEVIEREPAAPAERRGAPQSLSQRLLPATRPIVAATDYVRAYPQLIAAYVARALHRTGHRRLRPQRHARGTAALLRSRPPSHRDRGAGGAGEIGTQERRRRGQGDREIRNRVRQRAALEQIR